MIRSATSMPGVLTVSTLLSHWHKPRNEMNKQAKLTQEEVRDRRAAIRDLYALIATDLYRALVGLSTQLERLSMTRTPINQTAKLCDVLLELFEDIEQIVKYDLRALGMLQSHVEVVRRANAMLERQKLLRRTVAFYSNLTANAPY